MKYHWVFKCVSADVLVFQGVQGASGSFFGAICGFHFKRVLRRNLEVSFKMPLTLFETPLKSSWYPSETTLKTVWNSPEMPQNASETSIMPMKCPWNPHNQFYTSLTPSEMPLKTSCSAPEMLLYPLKTLGTPFQCSWNPLTLFKGWDSLPPDSLLNPLVTFLKSP